MGGSSSKQKGKGSGGSAKPEQEKASSTITSSDKVKLQLKVQRDNLVASIRKYERTADLEHEKAKGLMKAGNKRMALYCLKRERMQQDQIKTVTGILDNVQKLIDTVEFAQIESEVVSALSSGKTELDRLNKMLNIDDIEKLMSETAESVEVAREIDHVLSQPLSSNVDNDELLEELRAQMEPEGSPTIEDRVKVPAHDLPTVKTSVSESEKPSRVLEAA